MPRVHTRTRNKGGKHTYRCTAHPCLFEQEGGSREILPGQTFYVWQKRYGGPQRRHTRCGYPRPTQLSNRKTAQVEEAVEDASAAIQDWTVDLPTDPTDTMDVDASELRDILQEVADAAESVADEYESSADNMPESLQYGQQAEAMRDVAERLRDWASNITDAASDETIDLVDPEEYTDEETGEVNEETWRNDAQAVLDDTLDQMRSAAEDAMQDMPELEM